MLFMFFKTIGHVLINKSGKNLCFTNYYGILKHHLSLLLKTINSKLIQLVFVKICLIIKTILQTIC